MSHPCTPATEPTPELNTAENERGSQTKGVALLMVIAAMSMMSIIVTEFTYIAQVNQRMAYDSVDQVRAYYLAKSAFKLSLLRLKAYQALKGFASNLAGSGGGAAVPKKALEMVWSFPIAYPIPSTLPGLTSSDKERIEKFNKESSLDGAFMASIESESTKFNLNSILPSLGMAAAAPTPTPSASASPSPGASASPSATPTMSVDDARKSFSDFITEIFNRKVQDDDDFSAAYRDFRLDEFFDAVYAWADRTHEPRVAPRDPAIPYKGAPFYSVSELHQLPHIDDTLYDLFAPNLTITSTGALNLNSAKEAVLAAVIPGLTKEEWAEFFKYRDDVEKDQYFRTPTEFFEYLKTNTATYRGSDQGVKNLEAELTKRGVVLVTEDSVFHVKIRATSRQATRHLEAWISVNSKAQASSGATPLPDPATTQTPGSPAGPARPDSGIRIHFMRIL